MAGLDTTALGILAAQAMGQLEERYGEQEVVLRTAALVLEVECGDGWEFLTCATDSRPWVQRAFLDEGIRTLEELEEIERAGEAE